MNKVVLMGRLTRDPEVRYTQGDTPMAIARYSIAVDRKRKIEGQADADFINIVSFGKQGEFAEKYLKKGMKVTLSGRIQTGKYTNTKNETVYTTDVVTEEIEFAESKRGLSEDDKNARDNASLSAAGVDADGFMNIPDGIDEELPFN